MKIIQRYFCGIVLFIAAIVLHSCSLDNFNLNKLASADDINPYVSAPLVFGTFSVDKLLNSPVPADNFEIPPDGMGLKSLTIKKTGLSFKTSAIDTVYLITRVTNPSPVEMEFDLSFFNSYAGAKVGRTFPSGKIPANASDFPVKFILDPSDQDNLTNTTDIKLDFKIASPTGANPIYYRAVKNTSFIIRISFYAPLNLWKLSN